MAELQKVSLNTNWQYRFAPESDNYSSVTMDDSDWSLTDFADIPIMNTSLHNILWLRKCFDLLPTDACVRYFLRSHGHVYPMTVYLRGQAIVHCDGVLDVDVTDYVSLDDNILVLAMRLEGQTLDTAQVALYLQAIYCDDLD